MKTVLVIATAAALAATTASAEWVYEGKWGKQGPGDGEFNNARGIAVSLEGNVYVADTWNCRIQYFTPVGSFLGKWGSYGQGSGEFGHPADLAFAPNGNVYVVEEAGRVQYFTPTGSFLGKWGRPGIRSHEFKVPRGIAISKSGNVYVADSGNHRIQYFTSTGSLLGESVGGRLTGPRGIDVSPWNGNVYVVDFWNRVLYFTPTCSFLGEWGSSGSGNGQFYQPADVAFAPDGRAYVADENNCRIQYFTPRGSFIGKWRLLFGRSHPQGVAFNATGSRCYVSAVFSIQYFNRNEPAVVPASLGKVKALFR